MVHPFGWYRRPPFGLATLKIESQEPEEVEMIAQKRDGRTFGPDPLHESLSSLQARGFKGALTPRSPRSPGSGLARWMECALGFGFLAMLTTRKFIMGVPFFWELSHFRDEVSSGPTFQG